MTAPSRHLDRLRARRLHGLVQRRAEQAASGLWSEYAELVGALPHLLRHNGLRRTVDYLRLLADPRGRDSQAARDLIDDWLHSAEGNHLGWHLQGWISGGEGLRAVDAAGSPVDHRVEYRRASRLALREADWLRRFVQSVPDALEMTLAHGGADVDADDDMPEEEA